MLVILFATICALISIWTYFLYPFLLPLLVKKINHPIDRSRISGDLLRVTVIIPTYNEQEVIRTKLKNTINQNFPAEKLQILVVDSASTDKTCDIIKDFQDKIKLIKQTERKGKINAVNAALKYAEGDIVFITDANAIVDSNSLLQIVMDFNDPTVGAVQPFHMAMPQNEGIQSEDQSYWVIENFLLKHESMLDSVSSVTCKGLAFRRELINQLNEEAYADDLDILFQIRKLGYRVVYEAEAMISELIPRRFSEWFRQKKRRTINTIKAMKAHKSIIFNPRYGLFSLMLFPSHKVFRLLSSLCNLFLLSLIFISIARGDIWIASIFTSPFLFIALSGLLITKKFQTQRRNNNAAKSIFTKVLYLLAFQILVIMACFESFMFKEKAWDVAVTARAS